MNMGIDLGGTGIKVGVVNDAGHILHKGSMPTLPERGHEAVIHDMAKLTKQVMAEAGIAPEAIQSVGVGIPGIEDVKTGIVPFCTNLGWHEVPLKSQLSALLGKPVFVANDATVAALAEATAGASKGTKSSVLVTLGTGVGGGVILDGKPFVGVHGVATEVGHMVVKFDGIMCSCGHRGCWERYASATAIIREGKISAEANPEGMIARSVENDLNKITAKTVIDCARAGDPDAVKLFDDYCFWIAVGLGNLVNAYDPEVFVLGGGVSAAGDFLLMPVREKLKETVFFRTMPYARVEIAQLGNDAGIIGAAMLG